MDITRESFDDLVQRIGTTEEATERTTLLTELSDNFAPMFQSVEDLTNQNNDLNEKLTKAQERNMELFLRVSGKSQAEANAELTGNKQTEEKKLSYDDLFDENGRLK